MNKLTKDQAEWLLQKITKEATRVGCGLNGRGEYFSIDETELVINQCTEKEFPEYITDSVKLRTDNKFDFPVVMTMPAMHHHFELQEFKKFTDGCNEIMKWLEGQE